MVIIWVSYSILQEQDSDAEEDSESADVTSHPDADTTIVFVTGEGLLF